jgi:hypothetical protein
VKQTWWSRRAIGLHVVILIVVPTFAALCLWQLHRALDGNGLSWAYVFEWPFFAGYAIYMWWRFLHEPPRTDPNAPAQTEPLARVSASPATPTADGSDPEAAERNAYNDYLSALAERDKRKQWR